MSAKIHPFRAPRDERSPPPLADRSDDDLMLLVRAGKQDALTVLVERHVDKLMRICTKLLGDGHLADEIVQETWLRVWTYRHSYRPEGKFVNLLLKTACNFCRHHARTRRRREHWLPVSENPADLDTVPGNDQNHVDLLLGRERQRDVERALLAIPELMREAILLRFHDELSYEDIAAIVGASESTVRSRVHHGLKQLRQKLKGGAPMNICPKEYELYVLLDGEATENRAMELRSHIEHCSICQGTWKELETLRRDIAAPSPGLSTDGVAGRVLARIAEAKELPPPPAPSMRRLGIALIGGLGMAAAVALALLPGSNTDPGEFTARGGPSAPSLRRDVGVTLRRGESELVPFENGNVVDATTKYAISYRNLGADAAFLMVFAVDAAGDVHWIEPAYLDAKDDPVSVSLNHAEVDQMLPNADAAVLDNPAKGPLRVITLISSQPLHVKQIEALPPGSLSLERLRAQFPGAELDEKTLDCRP
jgi:RNA polymerase sigma factor (sigma-70 family)